MQRSEDDAFNGADLHYLLAARSASREAHRASDLARTSATDPRVRALAHRARATQAEEIRAITSILAGWGHDEDGPEHAARAVERQGVQGHGVGGHGVEGQGVDQCFLEQLTAHAEASLTSARTELRDGFDGPSRLLAEKSSRTHWRALDSLRALAVAHSGGASVVR